MDILREILYKLPIEETETLCQVNRELGEICSRPDFWNHKLHVTYPRYQGGLIRNSPRETILELERFKSIPVKYMDGNHDIVKVTSYETLEELLADLNTGNFILYLRSGTVVNAIKIQNNVRFSTIGDWHRDFSLNTAIYDVVLRDSNLFLNSVIKILILQ